MTHAFKSKEEIEGNLTIAKFMGVENVSVHEKFGVYKAQYEYGHIDWADVGIITLDYHKDWNLLMEVVAKCNQVSRFRGWKKGDMFESYLFVYEFAYIEKVYKAVVEFIKWYNENENLSNDGIR